MECRRCGACCIAISLSSSIPGMPEGKQHGTRCVDLTPENLCSLFDRPTRPAVCIEFRPMPDTCGNSFEEALKLMAEMESRTKPT